MTVLLPPPSVLPESERDAYLARLAAANIDWHELERAWADHFDRSLGGKVARFAEMLKEWDESQHPRDERGRFAGGGGGDDFNPDDWSGLSIPERHAAWNALPLSVRDRQADVVHTIPARVNDILAGVSDATSPDPSVAVRERVGNMVDANVITPASARILQSRSDAIVDALREKGMSDEDARRLGLLVTDHLAAQEYEAMGRTLGDHGIRHLEGDIRMATDALNVIPHEGAGDTDERLMTSIIGAFHDAGYLTPPAQAFMDTDHKHWGEDYFNAVVRPQLGDALSADQLDTVARVIATHDDPEMDWQGDPIAATFRMADNLALFQSEKMPAFAEMVPANIKTLVSYARGEINLDECKAQVSKNIAESPLPDAIRYRLEQAVPEISPLLPKFTVGMVGAKVSNIAWNDDHVAVTIQRSKANEALSSVLDMGQRQFVKMAESFGGDPAALKSQSNVVLTNPDGSPVIEFNLQGPLLKTLEEQVDGFLRALKEWDESAHPRDERGRFMGGGGGDDSEGDFTQPTLWGSLMPPASRVYPGASDEEIQLAKDVHDNWRSTVAQYQTPMIQHFARDRGITEADYRDYVSYRLKQELDKASLYVRVEHQVLSRVLADGRFKSQFEAGDSNGYLSPSVRSRIEQQLMGEPLDIDNSARPIYGYAASDDTGGMDSGSDWELKQYGDVAVHLDDGVRDRTTFTIGDSLDDTSAGLVPRMAPCPINAPTEAAVPFNDYNDPADMELDGYTVRVPYDETSGDSWIFKPYVEIQVHGGVTTQDIKNVVFKEDPPVALARKLDAAGISWDVLPH